MNQLPRGAFSSQPKEKRPHGYSQYALNNYDPQQYELYQQGFEHVSPDSYTSQLARGEPGAFEQEEAPALRQFNELQGNIASRFSGQGMGARKSSGFQNTMSSAAQDFAGQLQANRQQLRRQAIQDLLGMSETMLNRRPQEKGLLQKGSNGGWGEFFGNLAGSLPGMLTGDIGGALKGGFNSAKMMMGGM
jgi:hypothetical protein